MHVSAMQHPVAATIYLSQPKRKFWLEISFGNFNIVQCVIAALPRQRLRPDGRFLPELGPPSRRPFFLGHCTRHFVRRRSIPGSLILSSGRKRKISACNLAGIAQYCAVRYRGPAASTLAPRWAFPPRTRAALEAALFSACAPAATFITGTTYLPGSSLSPGPNARCMSTLSTQRPSLKPIEVKMPTRWKPSASCRPMEAALAESPITATI
jgi:hypothetical protein